MTKKKYLTLISILLAISMPPLAPAASCQPSVEISTEELKAILAGDKPHARL